MGRQVVLAFACNRGEISPLALARTDQEPLRLGAERQLNWLPRVLGPMMLRPGTEYICATLGSGPVDIIPFVASFTNKAILEITNGAMRILKDDVLLSRTSVSTTFPIFDGSWALAVTGTATAVSATTLTFALINNGALATAIATVSVSGPDQDVEHAVRIVVNNGPVNFQIGTTSGGDEIFPAQTLEAGTYSLAFTPTAGTIYPQFSSIVLAQNSNTKTMTIPQGLQSVEVTSCAIESAGVVQLPTPWATDVITGPALIRYTQSANVVFVSCYGYPQYEIRNYEPDGWAIVKYRPIKGPFPAVQGDPSVAINASDLTGNITLDATRPVFKSTDVGTLFRLFTNSQTILADLSFSDTFSDTIRVTGVSYTSAATGVGGAIVNTPAADRIFNVTITGTWAGTLSLERSFEGPTSGFTVYKTFTMNQGSTDYNDGLSNNIVWYRIGFGSAAWTSGTAGIALGYPGGGGAGIAHVTNYTSPIQVDAEVLVPFYQTSKATDWRRSEWPTLQGYPTAVSLHEGRLWWAGADRWWGSISDDYSNFDYDATGDSAPIDSTIGQGPISNINWLLSLDHLLAGADTSIIMARSDAVDTPMTPTNFNLRQSMTNGSYPIQAVRVDSRGIYINQSGRRIYVLVYDIQSYNYKSSDLTKLNPEIGAPGFVDMAVQRQPDTRINLVRGDGQLVSLLYDVEDSVQAFWRMETDGIIESIAILPGDIEDQVYLVVQRIINGAAHRYIEKCARIDECQGEDICKLADSHVVYDGVPVNQISGLGHLKARQVVVWADGKDIGIFTVDNDGVINFGDLGRFSKVCAGLGYSADFITMKLAYAASEGTAINQVKQIDHIGFVLRNTHYQGLRFGDYQPNPILNGSTVDYDPTLPADDMPLVELGIDTPADTVWAEYDMQQIEFPGELSTDSRIRLQAAAPRPVTVLGFTFTINTSG